MKAAAPWRLEAGAGFLTTPNGIRIRISISEFQLLNALLSNPGVPCPHAELAVALRLLSDEYNKHRVEVIVSRLRDKMVRQAGLPLPIQAERGIGYRFVGEIQQILGIFPAQSGKIPSPDIAYPKGTSKLTRALACL